MDAHCARSCAVYQTSEEDTRKTIHTIDTSAGKVRCPCRTASRMASPHVSDTPRRTRPDTLMAPLTHRGRPRTTSATPTANSRW